MTGDPLPQAVLAHAGVRSDGAFVARHGWSNRAWVGDDVVVRASSGRLLRSLAHEAAVCAALRADGFPVPEPIAAGRLADVAPGEAGDGDGDADRAEWLISGRLPGETLADAWPDLDAGARRRAGEGLGRFLRAVHDDVALDLAPAWWTDAHEPSGYHNAYRPSVSIAPAMVDAARELPFADDALLDDIAAFVDDRLGHFVGDDGRTAFCHTDVHGHNLLVDPTTGELTGVLDWEGAHRAGPDVDLDMLLRWVAAADRFPSAPGAPTRIAEGDAVELVAHVADAYPQLFERPHLRARLDVYEVQWQLVQLFFEAYWLRLGHGDASRPSASWDGLRNVLAGRHHLTRFELGAI